MFNPQPDPCRERDDLADDAQRAAAHLAVVSDETPDGRLVKRPSNREKVEQICRSLGGGVEAFDLTAEVNFDQLLRSLDTQRIVAGMYLADLRTQYYDKLIQPQDSATNEWWFEQFDNMLTLLYTGVAPQPKITH